MYSYGGSGKTVCVGVVQGSCKYANRLEELEGASAGSTPQAQGPIIRPRSSTMSRTSGMPNVAGRHPVDAGPSTALSTQQPNPPDIQRALRNGF
ncbi:uncharacterized protein LOC112451401 isoform X2 [Kryptolebias marmoratus]|uniref:uncharacterized protein LOC112451401 isoform X2 n=1 Tax=Kryptolebias marmoratus TaxID=37003 RepID=UPI0018ACCA8E|nr:uncharacterized protein LOC112451401 isoform X2 [Kryptolebias marmoratus]